jgi:hypothetical protein
MNLAFGESWDNQAANVLTQDWLNGDFSLIPPVKFVSSAEIGGANGAFAAATDTIYLSRELLAGNSANPAAVANVLLEEIGHSVDSRLNITDAPGDEGAIFAAVIQGKVLSEGELEGLRGEDDRATVVLGGQEVSIEHASFSEGWATKVYQWNGNGWNQRGGQSLTSNRSDAMIGIDTNWGSGSVNNNGIDNNFMTFMYKKVDLDSNKTYKIRVAADDYFYLGTYANGNWSDLITNGWQQAYKDPKNYGSYREYTFTPKVTGTQYMLVYSYEVTGDTYIDFSMDEGWDKNRGGINYNRSSGLYSNSSGEKLGGILQYMYEEMKNNSQSDLVKKIESDNSQFWNPGAKGEAYGLWVNAVAKGKPWDHKPKLEKSYDLPESGIDDFPKRYSSPIWGDSQHEYTYDIWSNIHYGYVGKAAGFTDTELQTGAAVPDWLKFNFDGKDVLAVQLGIELWNRYKPNELTPEILRKEIIANGSGLQSIGMDNGI